MAKLGPDGFERGLKAEEILEGRIRSGELQLLIKFVGEEYPEFVSATAAHMECPQLCIAFYEPLVELEPISHMPDGLTIIGFDQGLEADDILAIKNFYPERLFLMQWRNTVETSYVRVIDAYLACPQKVITFYTRDAHFPTEADVLRYQVSEIFKIEKSQSTKW